LERFSWREKPTVRKNYNYFQNSSKFLILEEEHCLDLIDLHGSYILGKISVLPWCF